MPMPRMPVQRLNDEQMQRWFLDQWDEVTPGWPQPTVDAARAHLDAMEWWALGEIFGKRWREEHEQ